MANKDQATTIECAADYASGDTLDIQGYESATVVLNVKATTSVALQESDDDSTYTDVDNDFIIVGDGAGVATGNDVLYAATGTGVIGYVGKKRYIQATVTDAATDATIVTILGTPHKAEVA